MMSAQQIPTPENINKFYAIITHQKLMRLKQELVRTENIFSVTRQILERKGLKNPQIIQKLDMLRNMMFPNEVAA